MPRYIAFMFQIGLDVAIVDDVNAAIVAFSHT